LKALKACRFENVSLSKQVVLKKAHSIENVFSAGNGERKEEALKACRFELKARRFELKATCAMTP
jgi:hypothetical protein